MNKFFGNNTLVPNGYVYTSHTGSKYVFMEGLWFNNSTMNMVNPTTYANMYTSAQKQIVEHNTKNQMKIGSVYVREGKEVIYLGEKKFITEDNKVFEEGEPSSNPLYSKIKDGTYFVSDGKKYVYDGNGKFITDDGEVYPQDKSDKIIANHFEKKEREAEDSKIKNDVDAKVDDTSTANPEDKHEEEKADQEQAVDDNDAKQDDVQEEDKIKSLADQIKANPKARNIEVLLTRADKLSLMAADILLSGQGDEVKKILQSLNSRDE